MKYKIEDISVIIPTYNRSSEILETLKNMRKANVKEILIIDQSRIMEEASKIKRICSELNESGLQIKYNHFDFASTAMARNKGIEISDPSSKIISFIDDDVTIQENYFETIISKFNSHPEVWGVTAYIPEEVSKLDLILDKTIRNLFNLRKYEDSSCRILCPYCNTYPLKLTKDIYAQWFPGVTMSYKKDIFNKYHFDNCLGGYSLAEDMEFSYSLFLANPRALLLTPDTLVEHRFSAVERADIKKMSYINQVDHFYFYWKYESSFSKIKHYWCIFGIFILRTLQILNFKTKSFKKWYYFVTSLVYCFTHKKSIKEGKVREWLK